MNCENTNENEYVMMAVNHNLRNCENRPKKTFFEASMLLELVACFLAL